MECFQKGPKATVGRVQCLEAPPEAAGSLAILGHEACRYAGCGRPPALRAVGLHPAQLLPRAPAWRSGRLADSSNHSTIFLLQLCTSPVLGSGERLRMPKKGLSLKLDWRPDRGRFPWLPGSCRDILTLSLVRGTL